LDTAKTKIAGKFDLLMDLFASMNGKKINHLKKRLVNIYRKPTDMAWTHGPRQ